MLATAQWICTLYCIHIILYYKAIVMNNLQLHTTTWKNLMLNVSKVFILDDAICINRVVVTPCCVTNDTIVSGFKQHLFAHESEFGLGSIRQLISAPLWGRREHWKLKPTSSEGSLLMCVVVDAISRNPTRAVVGTYTHSLVSGWVPRVRIPKESGSSHIAFYNLAPEATWCHFHHSYKSTHTQREGIETLSLNRGRSASHFQKR